MESSSAPGLEDCLRLLRGERDEQRLAGLLLATKLCHVSDTSSIIKVYEAVGTRFLDRLLMTGRGGFGNKAAEDGEAYLQLSVTILAAFCRVQEIASSRDILKKVPAVLNIISEKQGLGLSFYEECNEFLFLVATASEDGLTTLYDSGALSVLVPHISSIPDGSPTLEHALKILQLILVKVPHDVIYHEYLSELTSLVVILSQQFALLHNARKFDALRLLSILLSSKYSVGLHDNLQAMSSDTWATYIGVGIVAVLQNRVAHDSKLQALTLADSMMSILGESWLLQKISLPGEEPLPADRCLLLVFESSRVEVAVYLNDLAYWKYEASNCSITAEAIPSKLQSLAVSFSLVEKVIKLISNVCVVNGSLISENTLVKIIKGLDETIGLVLDFLKDAKDHGQRKGDELLASVRVIGSYLAETPTACKECVQELLEYILSVEAENETSPFCSICFMIPMLCQATMEIEGCRILISFGGHKKVINFLVRLIAMNSSLAEDNDTIFLACDTIMNVLLRRMELQAHLHESDIIGLLRELLHWAEVDNDTSVIMMAASLCSLLLDATSEEALLNHPGFSLDMLNSVAELILKSSNSFKQIETSNCKSQHNLHQIIITGYANWADRFPHVKLVLEGSNCIQG